MTPKLPSLPFCLYLILSIWERVKKKPFWYMWKWTGSKWINGTFDVNHVLVYNCFCISGGTNYVVLEAHENNWNFWSALENLFGDGFVSLIHSFTGINPPCVMEFVLTWTKFLAKCLSYCSPNYMHWFWSVNFIACSCTKQPFSFSIWFCYVAKCLLTIAWAPLRRQVEISVLIDRVSRHIAIRLGISSHITNYKTSWSSWIMKKFILSSNEKLPEILDCFGIDFFFTTWNIKEVHEDEQYNCWLLLNQLDNAFMYHKKFLLKKLWWCSALKYLR